MRFDDTLETVLAADLDTPFAAQSAWRQIVDLMGRGRIVPDEQTMRALTDLRSRVSTPTRAASARALAGARPPVALVRLFATDDIAVAGPVLRSAVLPAADWIAILPELTPAGRAILRHRRDLHPDVARGLAMFGPVDFVLPAAPNQEGSAETALPQPATDLPGEVFRIADVVARIEAYRRDKEAGVPVRRDVLPEPVANFRFETDATGAVRWVAGVAREPLVGVSLARPAEPGAFGVDGVAAGAFRRRAPFKDAHLVIAGSSDAGGEWRIAAVPAFDTASGRFTGYRGTARRPRVEEAPGRSTFAPPPAADAMRQLVHELRTPTNAIAGFSEMIEHAMLGPVSEPYRDQAIAIRDDARGLLAAIDDLDMAARMEAGALSLRPEPLALMPMLEEVVASLSPLAIRRGARLMLSGSDQQAVGDDRATRRLFERVIATVLSGASQDEAIHVTLGIESDQPTIAIDRPRAWAGVSRHTLLAVDDGNDQASLLGTAFALRLSRNLADELGGALTIGSDRLTLSLRAAGQDVMGQARQS